MSRTSENIIAINQLSVTLKTLEVGYKGRVSKQLSDQYSSPWMTCTNAAGIGQTT